MQNKFEKWFDDLFPLHRSITGEGNRQTLEYIEKIIPELESKSISSGTKVFDWTVPPEWNFQRAILRNGQGEKLIDTKDSNISVLQYSVPFEGVLSENELKEHLYTLPNMPDAAPYRTSYYEQNWGFCCSQDLVNSEKFVAPFYVKIEADSDANGVLNWGEILFPGEEKSEILISTYICHPSLANDNLSGILTAIALARYIKSIKKRKFSYRFVFCPETIGALVFLYSHTDIESIIGGTILTNTAGPGGFSLKQSFDKKHLTNRALLYAARQKLGCNFTTYEFTPDGSDERQYSKPGFRINTPSFHKSKYYDFEEYHTDKDNKEIFDFVGLETSLEVYKNWIKILERDYYPKFIEGRGELNLGSRNLYPTLGGALNQPGKQGVSDISIEEKITIMSWMMHFFDGTVSILEFSEKLNIDFYKVEKILRTFEDLDCIK